MMNPIAELLNASQIGYPKATEFKTMITLGHAGGEIPMLVPVICSVEHLKAIKAGTIRHADTLTYFPPGCGWPIKSMILLKDNQMKESSIPCILNDFTFFETDFIDTDKFNQLRKLTQERGGVFFKFSDAKMQPSLQFLTFLKRKFKYNAIFYEQERSPLYFKADPKNKDRLEIFVSFIDIKNAIPVFDPRKADGLAVTISVIKEGIDFYSLAVVFSNNRKNLFVVDGQLINSNAPELTLRSIAKTTKRVRDIIFGRSSATEGRQKGKEYEGIIEHHINVDGPKIKFKVNEAMDQSADGFEDEFEEEIDAAEEEEADIGYIKMNPFNSIGGGTATYSTGKAVWYETSTIGNTDDSDTSNNG